MKKKKVILVAAVILLVSAAVTAGILAFRVQQQRQAVEEAIAELGEKPLEKDSEDGEEEETVDLDTRLDQMADRYDLRCSGQAKRILSLVEDDAFDSLLQPENYDADGPEFTNSRKTLARARGKWKFLYKRWLYLTSVEGIMQEFKKGTFTEEEADMVEQSRKEFEGVAKHDRDRFAQTKVTLDNYFAEAESVFDFLSENRGQWEVEGGDLYFYSDELVEQYETLIGY